MELFYREYGSGDNYLIILHGLFGMSDNWAGLARKYSETHHVIVPDARNHGRSPHSPEFSLELMMDDLNELFEKLDIKNVSILGHSMGGRVAMNYALTYPKRVNKLIVADMSLKKGKLRPEHKAILGALSLVNLSNKKSYAEIEKALSRFVNDKRRLQFVLKNIIRTENGFVWKLNPGSLVRNIGNVMPELKTTNRYTKPTLFIRGGASDFVLEKDEPAIYEHFPNADIQTMEGASHWLHSDNPELFSSIVLDFLND
ncbi:MAG: alpha/beta fold hydrolase [Bacteroidales bacterium]|nr:alpha/beta fold hydrolase [Bacteroidales bacterium]